MIISAWAYIFYDEPSFTMLMIGLVLLVIPRRLAIIYFGSIILALDGLKK